MSKINQFRALALFISISIFIYACGYDTSNINLSFNECEYKLLDSSLVLVDVRTASEIKEGYIKNAIFINFYDDDFSQQISMLDKNKPTIIYCQKGGRSLKACQLMLDMGFSEVYNLEGGAYGWFMHGKKMVIPEK
jgi:rhodanese-related sulfurtransferase